MKKILKADNRKSFIIFIANIERTSYISGLKLTFLLTQSWLIKNS